MWGWFDAGSGHTLYYGSFAYDRFSMFVNAILLISAALVVIISPQYLIWIIPLVAYVVQFDRRWVVVWSILGLLTTVIYPFIYTHHPLLKVAYDPFFHPVTAARNLLLLGCIVAMLLHGARQQARRINPVGPDFAVLGNN